MPSRALHSSRCRNAFGFRRLLMAPSCRGRFRQAGPVTEEYRGAQCQPLRVGEFCRRPASPTRARRLQPPSSGLHSRCQHEGRNSAASLDQRAACVDDVNRTGSTLSERRYLRTVFRDSPVRRAISRIEKCCRYRQRRMTLNNSTLNNSMSSTPRSPAMAQGERFEHGSVLGGKTRAARVSSQWKSTGPHRFRRTRYPGAFAWRARRCGR